MAIKKHEKVMCREVYPCMKFMWRGIVFQPEPLEYELGGEVAWWSAEVGGIIICVENEWLLNIANEKLDAPSYWASAEWEDGGPDDGVSVPECYTREEALCRLMFKLPANMRRVLEPHMICTSNSEHSFDRTTDAP